MGDFLDPELTKPVKELKEKWKLLPVRLRALALSSRGPAHSLTTTHAHTHNSLPARRPSCRRAGS